jgi:hypothetical protein
MVFVKKPKTTAIFLENMGAGKGTYFHNLSTTKESSRQACTFISDLAKELSEQTVLITANKWS